MPRLFLALLRTVRRHQGFAQEAAEACDQQSNREQPESGYPNSDIRFDKCRYEEQGNHEACLLYTSDAADE